MDGAVAPAVTSPPTLRVPSGSEGSARTMVTGYRSEASRRTPRYAAGLRPSPAMPETVHVRPLEAADLPAWQLLWDGYNAFYGRHGETALAPEITRTAWQRFFDPHEPVFALVAEQQGQL